MKSNIFLDRTDDRRNKRYARTAILEVYVDEIESKLKDTYIDFTMETSAQETARQAAKDIFPCGDIRSKSSYGRDIITLHLVIPAEKPSLIVSGEIARGLAEQFKPAVIKALEEWYAEAWRRVELGQARKRVDNITNHSFRKQREVAEKNIDFYARCEALRKERQAEFQKLCNEDAAQIRNGGITYRDTEETEHPAIVEAAAVVLDECFELKDGLLRTR